MPHNGVGGDEEIQSLRLVLARLEHELRSPLQAVTGFARLLLDRVPERDRALVDKVLAGAGQLVELVDELSVEWVGGSHGLAADGSVRDALARSVALVELPAADRRVALDVAGTDADRPVPAALGTTRLTQVLVNLLANAVNFAPPESTVALTVHHDADRWTFAVTDQGPGVAPGDESIIFEPFLRRSSRPGSGLGLYVVKTLVEAAGGTVHVESRGGTGGARFTVVVPDTAT